MEKMKLIDIITNIEHFDNESIIFMPQCVKPIETTEGWVHKIKKID